MISHLSSHIRIWHLPILWLVPFFHSAHAFDFAREESCSRFGAGSQSPDSSEYAAVMLQRHRLHSAASISHDIEPFSSDVVFNGTNVVTRRIFAGGHSAIADGDAPLTEDGFRQTAAYCCELAMDVFVRRLIEDVGMTVCNEGGVNGFIPFLSCNEDYSFDDVSSELMETSASECAWVRYEEDGCQSWPESCNHGSYNATAHRRRSCPKPTPTTSTPPETDPSTTLPALTVSTAMNGATTTTSREPDTCLPNSVFLDFFGSTVTQNNLGGKGPNTADSEELRYHGIGKYNGQVLDLVVTVSSDVYRPLNSNNNGLGCGILHQACTTVGYYGQINLGAGIRNGVGETVDLTFTIEIADTKEAVTLPGFYLTILDIDQNKGDGGNSKVREVMTVKGYSKAIFDQNNEDIDVQESGSEAKVKSMKLGHGCDNPDDPNNLREIKCEKKAGAWNVVDQRKRSIMFLFENTASFDVTFETICNKCPEDARNFLFAAQSSLVEWCS